MQQRTREGVRVALGFSSAQESKVLTIKYVIMSNSQKRTSSVDDPTKNFYAITKMDKIFHTIPEGATFAPPALKWAEKNFYAITEMDRNNPTI